jgi:DNA-binding NtrC family response regulator
MTNNTILVVDDEIGIRELLSEILRDEGYHVTLAESAEQARIWRNKSRPDLVLLDIWMPDTDGVTLLKEWASNGLLTMPVVVMSGHGTIATAVEATRIGAFGYLEKPVPLQMLLNTVAQALRAGQSKFSPTLSLASLGKGPLIADLRKRLEQISNLKTPLLLTGEQGAGTELCAHFLHCHNTPWIEPDTCILLSDSPFDLLEKARDGLLFLKEIGNLNRLEQNGLLKLLNKLDTYNVRLVCASSLPLAQLTAQGEFEPKLYEILSGLCINVPALKEHKEDIPELANQVLSHCIESGDASIRQFNTAALNALRNYDWPGNLMQLTGTVRSLGLTCTGREISADDVKRILGAPMSGQPVQSAPINMTLREARDIFEKSYFEQLIDHEEGNMTRVAERAGLERTHLYRKLKALDIKLRSH